MARVVATSPFGQEFFGGKDEFEVDAANVFALVNALDRLSPGFADAAGVRVAIAVDGVVVSDWSTALSASSEAMLLPRVAGG